MKQPDKRHIILSRADTSKDRTYTKIKKSDLPVLPGNPDRRGEGGLRFKKLVKISQVDLPLVTIITVVFNGVSQIEETFRSVFVQSYPNIEYLVIDGGSTDGTVKTIRSWEGLIDYWVSEPDNGLYYAMNKGVSLARGEYIAFLNCGDYYVNSGVIANVIKAIKNVPGDFFCGWQLVLNEENGDGFVLKDYPRDQLLLFESTLPHPTTFHRRAVFEKVGLLDTKYRIVADYDWFLRAVFGHCISFSFIPVVVTQFALGGLSSDARHQERHINEKRDVIKKYFSGIQIFLFSNRLFVKFMRIRKLRNIVMKLFRWRI